MVFFFRNFDIFVCFVVAIFDQVHDVDAKDSIILCVNRDTFSSFT